MSGRRRALVSVIVLLALGALGGVLWRLLVDLPAYTRAGDNGSMEALELSGLVAIDGWYAVIAAVLAGAAGIGLTVWQRAAPRLNVLALTVGGGAAGLLMLAVGHWLGPGDVEDRLAAAAEGARVPVELTPSADVLLVAGQPLHVIFLLWPIAALAGSALVLLFGPADRHDPLAG